MKRYILFGLTLLMAFPVCVSAQDDDTEEDEVEAIVRAIKKKQKQYETRIVSGCVLNATTGQPLKLNTSNRLIPVIQS